MLRKYKNLNSDLRHLCKKLGTAAHVCNPNAGEMEQEDPWTSLASHSSQTSELQVHRETLTQKTRWSTVEGET